MPILTITTNLDNTPWEDLKAKRESGKLITAMGREAGLIRLGGLPRGMESGKAALEIAITLPDGTVILTETSMALFLAATKAFQALYGNESSPTEAPIKASADVPPVDRSAQTLASGAPVTDDHRELKPNGQQKDYVVLSAEERSKGFVRPVRRTYRHKVCNTTTSMSREIAETYARDPGFYSGTFCVNCSKHLPLDEFVWEGTNEQVGS